MQIPSDDAVELATRAFLASMRRSFIRRFGAGRECPITTLDDIPQEDQRILLNALKAALVAGHPDTVKAIQEG